MQCSQTNGSGRSESNDIMDREGDWKWGHDRHRIALKKKVGDQRKLTIFFLKFNQKRALSYVVPNTQETKIPSSPVL